MRRDETRSDAMDEVRRDEKRYDEMRREETRSDAMR